MAAGVSPAIIRRIEDFDGAPARSDTAAESLRAVISGGVELIYPADGRPRGAPCPQPQRHASTDPYRRIHPHPPNHDRPHFTLSGPTGA